MIKKPLSDPPSCSNDILALYDALDTLGGKWKLIILHYLITRENDRNTFKKIEKEIDGISAKVLTQELKALEMNQLISRTVHATKPITVEYAITEYGKTIQPVLSSLVNWGKNHRNTIYK